MKIKKILVCFCILMLIVGCGKTKDTDIEPQPDNKTYRNVKVIEIEGKAKLTRDKEELSVYKQMVINGGDNIVTADKSTVDLLLDSDKYARIFENSDVTFTLEGSTKKGAIRLYLNKGGINSRIENKLSQNDSYEIHTPDAVMAVRGTEFEVYITNINGIRQTTVTTESGSVEITLLNNSADTKLNNAGDTTVIEAKAEGNGQEVQPKFKDKEPEYTSSEPTVSSTPTTTEPQPKPEVNVELCDNCKRELKTDETHSLPCGNMHFSCDGESHTVCGDCGKMLCDLSIHTAFECGIHYPCSPDIYDGHEALACGHHLCAIINDSETVVHEICVVCKTYACNTQKPHFWAECGCVYCERTLGSEHTLCEYCGYCKTNGDDHGSNSCSSEIQ